MSRVKMNHVLTELSAQDVLLALLGDERNDMLSEIAAGISSLKAASDILKGLNAANIQAQLNEVKNLLYAEIFQARESLSSAQEVQINLEKTISELRSEIENLKNWNLERSRYELKRFYPGTFAYALKSEQANNDPLHKLCVQCFQSGQKGILQATHEVLMRHRTFECAKCRVRLPIGPEMPNDPEASG